MKTVTKKKKQQAAQVYFPLGMYFQMKQISKEDGKPLATWIRDLVAKELEKNSKKKSRFKAPNLVIDTEFEAFEVSEIDKIVHKLD